MNWLKKLVKTAQQENLTVNGLRQLLHTVSTLSPDIPGQGYLIEGPEINELRRLRGIPSTGDTQYIQEALDLFYKMYDAINDNLKEEAADVDPDAEEVEQEIDYYVEAYAEGFDFEYEQEKYWEFIASLDQEQRTEYLDNKIALTGDKGNPNWTSRRDEAMPHQKVFNRLYFEMDKWRKLYEAHGSSMGVSPEDVVEAYKQGVAKQRESIEIFGPPEQWNKLESQERWTARNDYEEGPKIFYDSLCEFTDEIIEAVADSNSSRWGRHDDPFSQLPDELPPWVSKDFYNDDLISHFKDEFYEWYKQDNYANFRDSAYESLGERNYENFREQTRALEHQYGFDVVNEFAAEPDLEDESDVRNAIDLSTIVSIATDFVDECWIIEGAHTSGIYMHMFATAIHHIISNSESLQFIFSQDLNSTQLDVENTFKGLEAALEDNWVDIPRVLETEELAEMKRRMEEVAKEQEKYHQMLNTSVDRMSPEELARMKELGISQRPFPHDYVLERGNFPGAGYTSVGKREPFRISIAPTVELMQEKDIPQDLLREMNLHQVGKPMGNQSLGWVGGYADYAMKTIYITEVQSDVMQRTVHMRDPDKVRKIREKEISRLTSQIDQLKASLSNPVSPKQQMIEKIQRIQQETSALDPNSPQYAKNTQLIERLQQQLPRIPDAADPTKVQQDIQRLEQQLNQINLKGRDFSRGVNRFHKDYGKWHDYKSRVENTFHDWIPVFFNVALREAKKRGFEKIRIISAESLMRLWAQYARRETKILFERVYDQTAKAYNAQPVEALGKSWYEIDLGTTERIAMNWFTRRVNKSAETHQWMVKHPDGRYVWEHHIDIFFKKMLEYMPELTGPEFDTGMTPYESDSEGMRHVFSQWLNEVPDDLKMMGELHPNFKEQVQQWVIRNYNFDPFENEVEDMNAPSPDDLQGWWT